ncbi:MAG: PHP domain-containing protein, partial [Deltaproteobacteria bacterium]
MQHSNFVHLHLHTQYSLLDGAIRPEALIALALEYRMPAVAMTDHGNIFGAVDFYQKAMARGIKPIIGCEVYVAPGSRSDRNTPSRGEAAFHLVLLVKNQKGYQNLCKLLTKAYLEGFYYRPRVDKELLKEMNEGLIALSACLHGEVSYNIGLGQMDSALKAAAEYKEIFPDRRFFIELQHNGLAEQEKVNKGLIEVSRALDIPVVATNDCHYLKKEDARVHDILLCIQTGNTVNTPNRMKFATDELYVKSPQEMCEAFKDIPEAISNTIEIAERCNFEMKLGEHHLPEFPVPPGETLDSLI